MLLSQALSWNLLGSPVTLIAALVVLVATLYLVIAKDKFRGFLASNQGLFSLVALALFTVTAPAIPVEVPAIVGMVVNLLMNAVIYPVLLVAVGYAVYLIFSAEFESIF